VRTKEESSDLGAEELQVSGVRSGYLHPKDPKIHKEVHKDEFTPCMRYQNHLVYFLQIQTNH
jgi:hypothetical protein